MRIFNGIIAAIGGIVRAVNAQSIAFMDVKSCCILRDHSWRSQAKNEDLLCITSKLLFGLLLPHKLCSPPSLYRDKILRVIFIE
jgi:hypothetical protein